MKEITQIKILEGFNRVWNDSVQMVEKGDVLYVVSPAYNRAAINASRFILPGDAYELLESGDAEMHGVREVLE